MSGAVSKRNRNENPNFSCPKTGSSLMQKLGSQNHAQQLLSVLAGEAIDWDNMEIMNESHDGNDKSY